MCLSCCQISVHMVWYKFSCSTVVIHCPRYKNIPVCTWPKKLSQDEKLPHQDDFCCHHGITSSITNTFATQYLPQLNSLQRHQRPSFCLVCSDLLFLEKLHHFYLGCKLRRNSAGIPHYSGIFRNFDRNVITVVARLLRKTYLSTLYNT